MELNPLPPGQLVVKDRYRPNPHFFLADRKTWIVVSIVLLLLGYGLVTHVIALSAGYQAGARWSYILTALALLMVPLALHALSPLLLARHGQFEVARCSAHDDRWLFRWQYSTTEFGSELPAAVEQLKALCEQLGLPTSAPAALFELLTSLNDTFRLVHRHTARIAGRALNDHGHPTLRIVITAEIGSPYCHARLWGPMTIVFPLGGKTQDSKASQPPQPQRATTAVHPRSGALSYLLAHELSHLMLREEPISLFADVRLVAIASALESSVWSLLGLMIAALFGFHKASALPTAVAVVLPMLMAAVLLLASQWARGISLLKKRGFVHGAATVVAPCGLAVAVLLTGLCASRFGLLGSPSAASPEFNWRLATMALLFVALLGRTCIYYGRRQIEFIADETAINSLSLATPADKVRSQMSWVLKQVHRDLRRAGSDTTPVPKHAVGHTTGFAESDHYSPVLEVLSNWEHTLAKRRFRHSADLMRWLQAKWMTYAVPMWHTHPTLLERQAVVENPDLQVQQDPTAPLFYAVLPLGVLPHYLNSMISDWPRLMQILSLFAVTPFLTLFFMVARRLTRLQAVAPAEQQTVHVGQWLFFVANQTGDPTGSYRVMANSPRAKLLSWVWIRLEAWWRGQPPPAEQAPATERLTIAPARPIGFVADIGRVAITLFLASLFSAGLVWLMGGNLTESIFIVFMESNGPKLTLVGATLFLATGLFSIYLYVKFATLAQWHFYEGSGLFSRSMHHTTNVALAGVPPLLGVALLFYTNTQISDLSGWGAWLGKQLAQNSFSWRLALAVAGFMLATSIGYAMVICWWPSRPSQTLCPVGHPVPMRPHNVLAHPEMDRKMFERDVEGAPDWAWLRCPVCGRAPQARKHLLCDGDQEAPIWRQSATPRFLLSTLFIIPQCVALFGGWYSGFTLLESYERKHRVADWLEPAMRDAEPESREPRQQTREPPDAPLAWRSLIRADLPMNAQETLYRNGLFERLLQSSWKIDSLADNLDHARPLGTLLQWSCDDALNEVRTQAVFLEACAQMRPREIPDDAACSPAKLEDQPELACRCLWHGTNAASAQPSDHRSVSAQVTTRIRATLRLYRPLHRLLHSDAVKEACHHTGKQRFWRHWHDYVEQELTPRLFLAMANPQMTRPAQHLRNTGERGASSLPEITPLCQQTLHSKLGAFSGPTKWPEQVDKLFKLLNINSCADVYRTTKEHYCGKQSGSHPACQGLVVVSEFCREKFQDLFACLSKPALERFQLEADAAVAILAALQTPSDETSELRRFVTLLPRIGSYQSVRNPIVSMQQILSTAGVDYKPTSRQQQCSMIENTKEVATELHALLALDGDGAQPPKSLDQNAWLKERIQKRQDDLLCALAAEKYQPKSVLSSLPIVDIWFATLGCGTALSQRGPALCTAIKKRLSEQFGSHSSSDPYLVKLCREFGFLNSTDCQNFLALPNECSTLTLDDQHRDVVQVLHQEFRVRGETAPGKQWGQDPDWARGLYLTGLTARLFGCNDPERKTLETDMCWRYRSIVAAAAAELPSPRGLELASAIEDSLGISLDEFYALERELPKIKQMLAGLASEIERGERHASPMCQEPPSEADQHVFLQNLLDTTTRSDRVMAQAVHGFLKPQTTSPDANGGSATSPQPSPRNDPIYQYFRECQSLLDQDRVSCANRTIRAMEEAFVADSKLVNECMRLGRMPLRDVWSFLRYNPLSPEGRKVKEEALKAKLRQARSGEWSWEERQLMISMCNFPVRWKEHLQGLRNESSKPAGAPQNPGAQTAEASKVPTSASPGDPTKSATPAKEEMKSDKSVAVAVADTAKPPANTPHITDEPKHPVDHPDILQILSDLAAAARYRADMPDFLEKGYFHGIEFDLNQGDSP